MVAYSFPVANRSNLKYDILQYDPSHNDKDPEILSLVQVQTSSSFARYWPNLLRCSFSPWEDLFQCILEYTNIVVYQCLLVRRAVFSHQANQGQVSALKSASWIQRSGNLGILVDLPQIQVCVAFALHSEQTLRILIARLLHC